MEIIFSLLARSLLIITGVILLVFASGFFLNNSDALTLWPWPDVPLSHVFVASILAAIGAPILWMGLSGELAAMRGVTLGLTVTSSGLAITLLLFGTSLFGMIPVKLFLTYTVVFVLFNMFLLLIAFNLPFKDQRSVPWLLRVSFLLFFVVLAGLGVALVMRFQGILPWQLEPQTSVAFGWVFIGAAAYFLYGFLKPVLGNARGQLIGLLTHALVLLVPFVQYLAMAKPEYQLSLHVYIGVLVYGVLLSLYFLFLHPSTRFGSEGVMYID